MYTVREQLRVFFLITFSYEYPVVLHCLLEWFFFPHWTNLVTWSKINWLYSGDYFWISSWSIFLYCYHDTGYLCKSWSEIASLNCVFFFHNCFGYSNLYFYINFRINLSAFSKTVCWNFIKDIWVYINEEYWPTILFSFSIFVGFWYQNYAGLIKWVGNCSFLFCLLQLFP